MSGPLPQALAQSAGQIAFLAESKALGLAHPGQLIARRARENLEARQPTGAETTGARVWRGMGLAMRTTLVMIASDQPGDPRVIAAQSWEAFSAADRIALGALCRQWARELTGAECLR